MSLRGFRVLPFVAGGSRYVLGADLVSGPLTGTYAPIVVSTGSPATGVSWTGNIWALVSVWSTGNN